MTDDLDAVRELLPGVTLSAVADLGGSDRSVVRRVRVTRPDGSSATVIVKRFHAGSGWARETAALAVLPVDAPAPRLLAAAASPPVVVMSDLGKGASVADALLGTDPEAARSALRAWIDAIAAVHRATLGLRDVFGAELGKRAESLPPTAIGTTLDGAMSELRDGCARLGVSLPDTLITALRDEISRLDNDAVSALSPSDACPDNNIVTGDGLALIDFEGAEWRHLAWDVAYLRVPWPSCWCSWRLPADVTDEVVARYRETMAVCLPYVATSDFDRDLAAATDLWSVLYSSWFLARALTGDVPISRALPSPQRRALLLHRLDLTRRTTTVTGLAAFADELRNALVSRWGEPPLALAPAFRPL